MNSVNNNSISPMQMTTINTSPATSAHTITHNPDSPQATHVATAATAILPPQNMTEFRNRLEVIRGNFTNIHDTKSTLEKISKLKEMKQGLSVLLQSDIQTNDPQGFDRQLKAISALSLIIDECIENEKADSTGAVSSAPSISEEAQFRGEILKDLHKISNEYSKNRDNKGVRGETDVSKILNSMIATIENRSTEPGNRLTSEECTFLKEQSDHLLKASEKNKNIDYSNATIRKLNVFLRTTLDKL